MTEAKGKITEAEVEAEAAKSKLAERGDKGSADEMPREKGLKEGKAKSEAKAR